LDSDPAIRWQVMHDLTGAPADTVAAERARVGDEGWGARLLALQQPGGQWPAGTPAFSSEAAQQWWRSLGPARQGTLMPAWTSTTWSLALLRAFGLDPDSAAARRAVGLVRDNVQWEHDGEPFFAGEVEPCGRARGLRLGALTVGGWRGCDAMAAQRQLPSRCTRRPGSRRSTRSYVSSVTVWSWFRSGPDALASARCERPPFRPRAGSACSQPRPRTARLPWTRRVFRRATSSWWASRPLRTAWTGARR
jgi:hypothetical protein